MRTALGEKLKSAGVDTDAALLNSIAVDLLRKNGLAPRRALNEFVNEVRDAKSLMTALHSREETEQVAIEYLQRVARDMRGDGLMVSAKADGGGQISRAVNGQMDATPSANSRDERDGEAKPPVRASAITKFPPQQLDDGAVHPVAASDGHPPGNSPSSSLSGAEAKLPMRASAKIALPSPGHPKRGLAELKVIRAAEPSIFDTQLLRDGTPLGDLRYSQLGRYIASNTREAALLRLVRDHGVPADPNARIRDIVNRETMQRFLQQAAEVADAA